MHQPSELDHTARLAYKAGLTLKDACKEFSRVFIRHALRESVNGNGRPNLCRTAKAIGIHRNTLSRTLELLGIDPWKSKS